MTADELRLIIEAHTLWLKGTGGSRADLSRVNLSGADLSGADLSRADLSRANLSGANLSGADLSGANLSRVNLSGADLSGADLSRMNLSWADLSGANLSRANLSRADLSGADLSRADLSRANLSGADLSGANLSEIKNAELILARTEIQPREGEVIGWKKCVGNVLVKVRIPPDAKRSNATGRKCRAERLEVLEVVGAEFGVSIHDQKTEYRAGQTVTADGWTEDRLIECGHGLHYFLTREEAQGYE